MPHGISSLRSRIMPMVAVVALFGAIMAPAHARGPVTEWGYLTTSDGARLRYTAVLPDHDGRFPVALIFSVYTDGVGPTGGYPPAESPVIAGALLEAGYAIVGVNLRGTGCSTGAWDLFQPASDGYEVVEWAASTGWSDGNVGMFGFSAPGISQLLTAATRPPSLRAITPADVTTDFYRDVAYPGGIPNVVFPPAWTTGALPAHDALSIAYAADQGDAECAANIAGRPQPMHGGDMLEMIQHPYMDKTWERFHPDTVLADIEVPLLTCQTSQDDQVTARAGGWWLDQVNPETSWAVFTNGNHGTCSDYEAPYTDMVVRFFDRYVRGDLNGFEGEPRVQIWHETALVDDVGYVPSWITTHDAWPVAVEPVALYARADGSLLADAPVADGDGIAYAYPLPASSMESSEYAPSQAGWQVHTSPGGAAVLTSGELLEDLEVFGPGSADLWLSSTAPDVDLQVTLTELRPDGQEMYVQRGWLRASHRALDEQRSTMLRPRHTHLVQDAAPLPILEPALARVELLAMSHVFRRGSRLRVSVEAPTGLTGLFGFAYQPVPALVTVLTSPEHPSRVVLGRVPGGVASGAHAECNTLVSQPCRPALR